MISLFYLGQWNLDVFEWAHLYVWQALIMLDVLIVWLVWVRTLPVDRVTPARRGTGLTLMRTPLGRFVLKVLVWLPVAFVVWYFGAPLLLWPVKLLLAGIAAAGLSDIVTAVEQNAAIFTFATALKPGEALGTAAHITVDVDGLLYSFGMPLFAALVLAAREPRWPRTLALGYAVQLPFVAWGVLADFLKNIAITSGPLVASQTGFSAWQREADRFRVPVRLADPADRGARRSRGCSRTAPFLERLRALARAAARRLHPRADRVPRRLERGDRRVPLRVGNQHVVGIVGRRRRTATRAPRRAGRSRWRESRSGRAAADPRSAAAASRGSLRRPRHRGLLRRRWTARPRVRVIDHQLPPVAHAGARVPGSETADRHRLVGQHETQPMRGRERHQRGPDALRSRSRSRSTRRCTLPVVVIGSASMNSISFGYS